MATPQWIDKLFLAAQASNQGVVRRSTAEVRKHKNGLPKLIDEVRQRGFHSVETGDQVVVLCHKGALTIHT